MFATLTSKGQLTLPKEIRDLLNLDAGSILDFQIQADNTVTARPLHPGERRVCPVVGIDTNILLPFLPNDGPVQNTRTDARLETHGGVPGSSLVTNVVLAEAIWTPKAVFEQDRRTQLIAVPSLLEETAFAFEDREAIAAALRLFGAGSCGFADCLVVA